MSNLESSDSATRSDLECDPCQGQLAFTGHSSLRADARLGIRRYFKSDFQALICKVEKKKRKQVLPPLLSFIRQLDVLFFS